MVERGGVIWVYMGPSEKQPPLPEWEFATLPLEHSYMSKRVQASNWLQALEGGIDSSHVSFLHSASLSRDPLFKGAKGNQYNLNDLSPVFEVVEADGGLLVGARRNAEDDQYYWRITPWIMPCFTAPNVAMCRLTCQPLRATSVPKQGPHLAFGSVLF
jgi:phenylpropionate dioxygenase-like ring-hydroxylating dioxygenase large terminal subunit